MATYEGTLSQRFAKQSMFMDLVVKSKRTLGGCGLWKTFIVDDVANSLITYSPIAITMIAKTTLESTFADVTVKCNISGIPAAIVNRFSELAVASALGQAPVSDIISTFQCGSSTWRVGQCANIAVPYICVDCFIDTCKAATSSLFESQLIPSSFWYQDSCANAAKVESSHEAWFRSLVVDYDYLSVAPMIVSMATSSPLKTEIVVDLVLDNDAGSVVCAAYETAVSFVPLEVRSLLLQNQAEEISSENVSFVVTGLMPSVDYDVYCATFSQLDAAMTVEDMLSTKMAQSTSCCRLIEVEVLLSSVPNNEDSPRAVEVALQTLLPEDLTITFTTQYYADDSIVGEGVTVNPFVPGWFTFTSTSLSLTKDIAYVSSLGSAAGVYVLDFELSGPSASSYTVSYVTGNRVTVLDSEREPAVPSILSAVFNTDGSSFVVLFDSPTNRGSLNNKFLCSKLFSFGSVTDETVCRWADDMRVEVYSNGNTGAMVNDTLSLLPFSLKAKCRVLGNGGPECGDWAHSRPTSVAIQAPSVPSLPRISLIAPAQIGPCDSLSVDLSSSSGAGGRNFASWSFSVTSRHVNASAVERYLNGVQTVRRPIFVPSELFASGYAYSLSVKLCTFLGGCSRVSHTVVVSSSGNIPVVSLNSEKIRNVNRFSILKVRGDGFTSQCGGTKSSVDLTFSWELQTFSADEGGIVTVTDPALQTTSVDPRFFLLPAYALPVGQLYTLKLTVQHVQSLKYSSASITLTAVPGKVFAVISGPAEVGLQVDRELVLDAGGSYDEDNNVAVGEAAGLAFDFDCKQIYPSYKDVCLLNLAAVTASSASVSVPGNDQSTIGSVHEVSLVVRHASDGRKSASSVMVSILPSLAPVVDVQAENNRINPSQKLKIVGTMEFVSPGTATWSLDDTSIDLEQVSSSVTSRILSVPGGGNVQTFVTMSLVIPPNVLPEQSTFNFVLNVVLDSGFANSATIVIVTNSPPLPGLFIVSPSNGTMLQTEFAFNADDWEDSDRPISYAFGFLQDGATFSVLRAKEELSYFATRDIPSGPVNEDYLLIAHVEVYDVMSARASASAPIKVAEGEVMSAVDIEEYLSESIFDSNGYSDGMKVAVAVTNVIVNSVNCSNMESPCASLNRFNCSTTVNTCGACFDGFVGEDNDANTKCVLEPSTNGRRLLGSWKSSDGEACSRDADCEEDSWEVCDENSHQCVIRSKQCPGDCGSNGTCIFISTLNASVLYDECNVLQVNCIGRCVCEAEFMGQGCDIRREDFIVMQNTRHKLVEAIQTISLTEDPTQDALGSWMQSLSSVCKDSAGLLVETKALIATLSLEFLEMAGSFKLSFEEISSLTKTLDLVISTLSSSEARGDSTLDEETTDLSVRVLQAYSDFIAQDMVEGQSAVGISTPSYRLGAYAVSGGSSADLQPPQSKLELATSVPVQSAVIPATSSGDVVKVSVIEVSSLGASQAVNSSQIGPLLSVPLGLRFDQFSCLDTETEKEFCSVEIVLQNSLVDSHPLLTGVITEFPAVVHECRNRRPRNVTHTCADGFNITQSCNGTKGALVFQCPSPLYSASCVSMGTNGSSCELVDFTATNVTCECTLPVRPSSPSSVRRGSAVSYFQRKASEEESGDSDTTVSVDFSSAASSTLGEFTTTFRSAGALNANLVLGSWEVLLTLGLIFVLSVMFISYGHMVDAREEKENETAAQLKNALHMNVLNSSSNNRKKRTRQVAPDISLNPTLQKKRAITMRERSKTMMALRRTSQQGKVRGADEHRSLDQALPSVLQPLPMWTRYKTELQVYHRWAGVYFHYSKVCSRPLRALSLVTNVVVMLFIEAVTYDLADPNDGSCERYVDEVTCLSEMSSLASESKCYWDEEEMMCNFKEIQNDMLRVVIVAIFAACLGTPFAILLQVLIQKFLSGEIDEGQVSTFARFTSRGNVMMGSMRGRNLVGVDSLERGEVLLTRGRSILRKSVSMKNAVIAAPDRLVTSLQEDLSLLFTDLRAFRRTLSRDERNKFDDVWGLSFMMDEGIGTTRNYYNKIKTFYNTTIMKRKRPELVLLDELERVRDAVTEEVVMFESSQLTETQKSKRLLFLFVRDLLDGANGQILDAKNRRDNTVRKRVTMDTKILVSTFVTFTLLGMLFYVYLFALRQTQERQQAWFQSFVVWMIFEIFLVSTGMVFITHIIIPTFVVSDVKRVKQKIVDDIIAFKASVARHTSQLSAVGSSGGDVASVSTEAAAAKHIVDEIESRTEFNAAKYLFASSRLARMYPDLKDSSVVAKFSTQWPRRSLKTTQKSVTNSYNKKLSFVTQAFSRVLLFTVSSVIQLPEPVQDIIFQLISTSGFGYVIVIFMNLWRTSPLLVAVPVVILILCVHFITATSKSSSLLPLNKARLSPKEANAVKLRSNSEVNASENGDGVVDEDDNLVVELDMVGGHDSGSVGSDNDTTPSQQDGGATVAHGEEVDEMEGLSRLQYLLWGKDIRHVESSDTDSDENCDEFFEKRQDEMAAYMLACSEGPVRGRLDSLGSQEAIANDVDRCDQSSMKDAHSGGAVAGSGAYLRKDSGGGLSSPLHTKSSPVAAALTVNSRAGALNSVRRKSLIHSSSITSEDGKEDEEDAEDDEDIVERVLQRPKEVLRCISPDVDIGSEILPSPSTEEKFSRRSEQVEARLRNELKKPDILVSPHDRLRNFSDSSASGESDEDNSVHVMLKQSSIRMAATSDSESEHGVSKLFSAPFVKDDLQRKLSSSATGVVPSVARIDPKNPFNLNEAMFDLSDDSED